MTDEQVDELIRLDHEWVPRQRGQSFYIRPLIFGTESHLEVRASRTFRLIIMTAPVRAYFDANGKPVSLKVEERHTRAAPGGTGAAKTAGNYAASLQAQERAKASGYDQVLWLDAMHHRDIEELSTAEAARVLGVSENAVKLRLHRARQALRTLLAERLGKETA